MEPIESDPANFSGRLFEKLATARAGKNLFFSPLSIRVALAMCAAGANGETRRELTKLIGAPENVEEQNRQYSALMKTLTGDADNDLLLVIANALWVQKGFRINPAYANALAELYQGDLNDLDFRDSKVAAAAIDAWVCQKTNGRINEIVRPKDIVADTRLILTNAIYFKGSWEKPFELAGTTDGEWYGSRRYKVPMMHQRSGNLYYESDDLQALNLRYKMRNWSMLVVLPRKKDGLPELERRWEREEMFKRVTIGLDPETVIVTLPRFRIEAEFALSPVLQTLDVSLAFGDDADFSGIGEEPLKISEVLHKAFVEVNEMGTEAAAATAVIMMRAAGLSGRPPEPKVFTADHQFLFFIWERRSGTVLFSGRVNDPK